MKRLAILCAGVLVLLAIHSPSMARPGSFQHLKVGGGFLWNDDRNDPLDSTGGGLHASADFELIGPFVFSPFYEFSRRNSITSSIFGGEFHYDIPLAKRSKFYFGPGFGVADALGKTEFHLNGVGGFKVDVNDWIGVFVQGKYVWADDDVINGITAHVGVTFPLILKK